MPSDLQLARQARLQPIGQIAQALGIPAEAWAPHGHHKAKLSSTWLAAQPERPEARLVLVTAISPTPAGEGKTTTTVGLGDALHRIGRRAIVCLRQPSLGPVFGMKGGAAGGGRAQVAPMDEINLHFTGDFHAIAAANNLLAAMVDNHLHHGNALGLDSRRIAIRRVLDMNDRALRHTTIGLGGPANGIVREDGFDIVVASEVMAIFCLAESLADLKARLGRIIVGRRADQQAVQADALGAHGAMAALLREAFMPNLVQTLEGRPALVHGGPFANIAHGCSSVAATRAGLKLADWVVTEAGFGADLGAEKFIDIKCRQAGLRPAGAVLVATVRGLKYHGGAALAELGQENLDALARGMANLERHVDNLRRHFGLPVVVAINRFSADTEAELQALQRGAERAGAPAVLADHWAQGSAGAEALAQAVVAAFDRPPPPLHTLYADTLPLADKIERVATAIYRADGIDIAPAAQAQLARWQAEGHGALPVCIAKTPYAFSADAQQRGAASGHRLPVRELRLAAGAGFVVALTGEVMTMPGLPKTPAALHIDVDDGGQIVGLG